MELETMTKAGSGVSVSVPSVDKTVAPQESPSVETVSSSQVQTAEMNGGKQENGSGTEERVVSESSIQDAVSTANRKMVKTRCEYSYHKETNRVSIKVFDADTDEVIREIPPEKSLDMLEKMWEMAGILVDEKR